MLQEAVAIGIEHETDRIHEPTSYWKGLCTRLQEKRDRVCNSLSCIGMTPTVPQGGYFIMADFSNIGSFCSNALRISNKQFDSRDRIATVSNSALSGYHV